MDSLEVEKAALESITCEQEDDEHVVFDVQRYAQLEWDEDRAPGRPEMTGQWRLHYRDGSADHIDLPLANVAGAAEEAKKLIAKKLAGR